MTFRAIWDIYPADLGGRASGANILVHTPEDVDQLIRRLGEPLAGTAKVWGPDTRQDGWTGQLIHVAVNDGFGYLSYTSDTCGLVFATGDPDSPDHDSEDEEFPAGSGISLSTLGDALKEFLATGTQPKSPRWAEPTAFAHVR